MDTLIPVVVIKELSETEKFEEIYFRVKKVLNNAKIVLSSSWKSGWERVNKELQDREGNYLDRKLRDEGMLILDKTEDRNIHHLCHIYKKHIWHIGIFLCDNNSVLLAYQIYVSSLCELHNHFCLLNS